MKRTKPLTYEEALSYTAGLCAKCEQCTPDLRKKMATRNLPASDIERVIRELERMNFVDDDRFARAYAHDKLTFSGWGKNKIIQGLWAKRLSKSSIAQAMDGIEPEEYADMATRVIKSKIRMSKDGLSTYESKLKILKYAMQRGFECALASRIINDICRKMRENDYEND